MLISLSDRKIISVIGPDSINFFQRITTADIGNLSDGTLAYTFILNNRGRFLFDFFILKRNTNQILIDIHHDFYDDFIKTIKFYILREDIKFDEKEKYHVYFDDQNNNNDDNDYAVKDPRHDSLGYRIYTQQKIISANDNLNDYHLKRVQQKIPDGFYDMEREKSIILEYGCTNHIGWKKGCYIGQELMAKTKYRGNVSKGLFLCKISNDAVLPLNDQNIITDNDGVKIGKICNFYDDGYFLSIIRKDKADCKIKINDNIKVDLIC